MQVFSSCLHCHLQQQYAVSSKVKPLELVSLFLSVLKHLCACTS
jgi:hypothetical protein